MDPTLPADWCRCRAGVVHPSEVGALLATIDRFEVAVNTVIILGVVVGVCMRASFG